jgi:hypothetical protein
MKALGTFTLAAAAAAIVIPAMAAEVTSYGRAGGAVGAQRIEQLASYVSPRDLREFDAGYGRAGGPVASAQARTAKPAAKVDVAVDWYGRAGRPQPFGG